jgi:hypothetical protein
MEASAMELKIMSDHFVHALELLDVLIDSFLAALKAASAQNCSPSWLWTTLEAALALGGSSPTHPSSASTLVCWLNTLLVLCSLGTSLCFQRQRPSVA